MTSQRLRRVNFIRTCFLLAVTVGTSVFFSRPIAAAPKGSCRSVLVPPSADTPAVGKLVPTFTLQDVDGRARTLAEFRGRPVALFFFCGCSWCSGVAKEWAALQRGGALEAPPPTPRAVKPGESVVLKPAAFPDGPATVVVYSEMNGQTAKEVATIYGLDLAKTVVLPDPDIAVTQGLYRAEPCPRVFVLDVQGVLRYTNEHADDAPRMAPAFVIASRALEALRTVAAVTPPPTAGPRKGKTVGRKTRARKRAGKRAVPFAGGRRPSF